MISDNYLMMTGTYTYFFFNKGDKGHNNCRIKDVFAVSLDHYGSS